MNLTPASELVDEVWGKVGTPERDEMEAQLKEELNAYFVGKAIKKARQAQNLTQEELGERISVQRAQFEGEYAVRQLEIHNNFIVMLTDENPNHGEYYLYDQNYSDINWSPEDYITKEEFNNIWNQFKNNSCSI